MSEKHPSLVDPSVYPNDEVIAAELGASMPLWESFHSYLHEARPDFVAEWRYYKDGGAWLMKVQRKKKTVFWTTVWTGFFSVTFYFSDKAEPLVEQSSLPPKWKTAFADAPRFGKIRGLRIDMTSKSLIQVVDTFVDIRLKV